MVAFGSRIYGFIKSSRDSREKQRKKQKQNDKADCNPSVYHRRAWELGLSSLLGNLVQGYWPAEELVNQKEER